jgi:transcriptional regulator with XRE-family HTH domain
MSRESAVRLILIEYLELHNMSLSEFGRKSKVNKATLSKLLNNKYGKIGISGVILGLIANGMCMDLPELEEKIIEYQTAYQNGEVKPKTYTDKDKMIALISDNIKKLDIEELKILHSIILEVDKKALKSLDIIIKNMKNMQ